MIVQPASWSGLAVGVLLDDPWPGRISVGSHGYAQVTVPGHGRVSLLHRVLLGLQPGDGLIGDHRNRSVLDCRRSNLRVVDAAESSSNVSARTASGYRGVYRAPSGRWVARGKVRGRMVSLGTYDTVEEAAEVAGRWRAVHLPGYVPEPA